MYINFIFFGLIIFSFIFIEWRTDSAPFVMAVLTLFVIVINILIFTYASIKCKNFDSMDARSVETLDDLGNDEDFQ